MRNVLTYRLHASATDPEDTIWEELDAPPGLKSFGAHDFLWLTPEEGLRGFVDGIPVVRGIQVLRGGSLVRILGGAEEEDQSYLYFGRTHEVETVNPGPDARCTLSGMPLTEMAFRCPACDRLYSPAAVEHLGGQCICEHPLSASSRRELPAEELK